VSSTDTITWYETSALSSDAPADLVWIDSSIEAIENLAVPLLVLSEFFSQEENVKTASRIKTNDLVMVFMFLRFKL
jgi:hypothetical protein